MIPLTDHRRDALIDARQLKRDILTARFFFTSCSDVQSDNNPSLTAHLSGAAKNCFMNWTTAQLPHNYHIHWYVTICKDFFTGCTQSPCIEKNILASRCQDSMKMLSANLSTHLLAKPCWLDVIKWHIPVWRDQATRLLEYHNHSCDPVCH